MLERLYRSMLRIRRTEEAIVRLYPTDVIKSPVHLSIGQEAVSVGLCEALAPRDVVFGTYRSHALYLAKGGDLRAFWAELYGKATGCARGKGGSMHLIDTAAGVMGTSAVVGTTIPLAVGYAYAQRFMPEPRLTVSVFGDGAIEEGAFHESLNFAALKQVPILFVCENNGYAIHAPIRQRQPEGMTPCGLARAHGIMAMSVTGDSPMTVYLTIRHLLKDLTASQRPYFVECLTSRWREHVGPNEDWHLGYRDRSEVEPHRGADGLKTLAAKIGPYIAESIEKDVMRELDDAIRFAEESPFPDASELHTDLYQEA